MTSKVNHLMSRLHTSTVIQVPQLRLVTTGQMQIGFEMDIILIIHWSFFRLNSLKSGGGYCIVTTLEISFFEK